MVDSGAAHSACPSDNANDYMKFVRFNERFKSRRPVVNSLNIMVRLVPYMAQDRVVEITYQVTDVEGPVAAVTSMNDGGKTVVFSPQGTWVCDETPLKPVGCIELKRENRTFWMDLPRADSDQVQRMMALRHEQPVEQVERIAGKPAIEEKGQGIPASADPTVQDNEYTPLARARKPPLGPTIEYWTNMNSHTLCLVLGENSVFPAVPKKIHTVVLHRMKVAHQKSCWIGCFVTSDQELGVQLLVLVVCDLSTVL